MTTIQASKPRSTQPHVESGTAEILGIKPTLLTTALRREGWSKRRLTRDTAEQWATNPELAPPRVRVLVLRAQKRRELGQVMSHEVAGVLRVKGVTIAQHAREAGAELITAQMARAWVANPESAPAWIADLQQERDERLERRALRRAERDAVSEAEYTLEQEAALNEVAQRIIDGKPLREDDLEFASEIFWDALTDLMHSQSSSTQWISSVDAAVLELEGIDVADQSTWPFEVRHHELPRTNLLEQLLEPTGLNEHIVTTIGPDGENMDTSVSRNPDGVLEIELPFVIRTIEDAVAEGFSAPIILRSFDMSREDPMQAGIPIKVLRSWLVQDGGIHPMDEAVTFSIHCTDAGTGEPMPPEPAVEYSDAWGVEAAQTA